MYKSIVVPVDMAKDGFSDLALTHARQLLNEKGCLHIVHVVPGYQNPWVGSFFPDDAFDKALKQSQKDLEAFLEKYFTEDSVKYKSYTLEGKPADLILKTATKVKADLIVMASHKHSRIEKAVLGSIANKVVGRSKIPVMVVKKG
ncbi:universal stress protein [Hahella ganghwensis]|uniref:universal stress protein n=1 Tax=Hahella ganghwensis TaxID=286420 RepID=UPI00036399D4|nr:universal stress protein [Hahella ganghwensis]